MQKLTHRVLQHKRIVVIGWVVLTLIGIGAAGPASKALNQKFSVPGREGWETNQKIIHTYGNGGENPPSLPVVTLPSGKTVDSPGVRSQLAALESRISQGSKHLRVAGFGSTADRAFVSKDGRTTFIYAFPPPGNDAFAGNSDVVHSLRKSLTGARIAGAPVHLTGYDALNDSSGGGGGGPGVLIEALFGGLGALVVLAFVFGSFLAFIPILMAICSVLVTFLLLWALTTVTSISPIVQFLCALIGLGVSIDYALLVVVRWREERENGLEGDAAVEAAMATAGRAVVFSGTTVAVGLLALVVLPLPFLRSVGYGGMLIPLVATLVAITLLPTMLATVGPRMDKRRLRRNDRSDAHWQRWSTAVVRRRWPAAIGALVVLLALLTAATNLHMGNADPNTIAKSGDAKDGLRALDRSGIGTGAIVPIETLAGAGDAEKIRAAQAKVRGINGVVIPTGPAWIRGDNRLVEAVPNTGDESAAGRQTVKALRSAAHDTVPGSRVGGTGPEDADFISAVYGSFPLMIALIAVFTFLLLARAFRSLLLPLKAVVLNVISVGAAWGVISLIWQEGHGSQQIWGISATGSVAAWIPLMIFAFLYGLSMDYEVFILARMREQFDRTGETDDAVITGLGRTGRLVTSAALILFLAFVSMASGPETDVKILATGLAAGILIDATIVRALLVPAVVSLFGKWNWWLPAGPARFLRVRPSPEPATDASG
jgi:RND superfamily putative drug exporter